MRTFSRSRTISLAVIGAIGAFCVLSVSGCSAPSSTYDKTEKAWFAAPFDVKDVPVANKDDTAPDPNVSDPTAGGTAVDVVNSVVGDSADDFAADVDPSSTEPIIRPCDYVSLDAWKKFTGDTKATSYELDPGEKCIYLETSDLTRVTVEYYPATGHSSWLGSTDLSTAVPVQGLGTLVQWFPRYPVAYASTMVGSTGVGEAIVTIYSNDPKLSKADKLAAATDWMKLVLSGVQQ